MAVVLAGVLPAGTIAGRTITGRVAGTIAGRTIASGVAGETAAGLGGRIAARNYGAPQLCQKPPFQDVSND